MARSQTPHRLSTGSVATENGSQGCSGWWRTLLVVEDQRRRKGRQREGRRPPGARRSPTATAVLPVLDRRGLSTKAFAPALAECFGSEAGLSASTLQRLTRAGSAEWAAFPQRDLSPVDDVSLWADGVPCPSRLEQERLGCLVLVGGRADGRPARVAVSDGYRESRAPWSELLHDLKRRGRRAPVLAPFDGPAEPGGHLRTTTASESTCATVRLRTNQTTGAGSRTAGLAMTSTLLTAAPARWRCVNAPQPGRARSRGGDLRGWLAGLSSAKTSGTPREHHRPFHNS